MSTWTYQQLQITINSYQKLVQQISASDALVNIEIDVILLIDKAAI